MGKTTILGQSISLIRPFRIAKHSAKGAWDRASAYQKRKTHKLSQQDKKEVAALMGYELTGA